MKGSDNETMFTAENGANNEVWQSNNTLAANLLLDHQTRVHHHEILRNNAE